MKIKLENIDYKLSLYYSYLLPLFKIELVNGKFVFTKIYGSCKGLKCIQDNSIIECIIPGQCKSNEYKMILGFHKKRVFNELMNKLYLSPNNVFRRITLMYSNNIHDRKMVLLTIFLSRNTDYYKNTIRWVKIIIEKDCIKYPYKCFSSIRSYQYKQLVDILNGLLKVFEASPEKGGIYSEILDLLKIKYIGLKTINAYLLHAYGNTYYAPIDRHYRSFLRRINLDGVLPSKHYCSISKLDCEICPVKQKCLYYITRYLFGKYNGVLQSISYIYGRISTICNGRIRLGEIEELMLRELDNLCRVIDRGFSEIIEKARGFFEV